MLIAKEKGEVTMTNDILQSLLKSTAALSALLLAGFFLRSKIKFFRTYMVPASIIGGFIGLLLGPQALGDAAVLKFSDEWIQTWSLLPGILIIPIFSSLPLGQFKNGNAKKAKDTQHFNRIAMVCGVVGGCFGMQIVIGVGLAMLLGKLAPQWGLYNNFGFELVMGYNGGHGNSGLVGNTLMQNGVEYWEVAQGVTTTFATIGLIGGMMLGIFFINRAARKGQTALLKEASKLPDAATRGYTKNIPDQKSMGRETTTGSTVETLSIHLGIILIVCGMAYYLVKLIKQYNIPALADIPVWSYGLFIMYGVNCLLQKLHLDWMIDMSVKSHIIGAMSDIAIVAAIASMPIKAVFTFFIPIVLISAAGFVIVYYTSIRAFQLLMPNSFPFERGIMVFGINTGVMITGLTLLKICDPDYETPAMEDYSLTFLIRSIIELPSVPLMFAILGRGKSWQMLMYGLVYALVFYVIAAAGKILSIKAAKSKTISI